MKVEMFSELFDALAHGDGAHTPARPAREEVRELAGVAAGEDLAGTAGLGADHYKRRAWVRLIGG